MSAAVANQAQERFQTRSYYGRLKFVQGDDGVRDAWFVAKGCPHDLRGPVENSRGTKIQTLLSLDVDVRGSDPVLLGRDGLDLQPFRASLARDLPYCAGLLRYVVRTPGGGFHPSFTIVPLPLLESTISNQRLLLSIQDLLARYLLLLGYNADRAAFGLGKTYASPENFDRLLYESESDNAWKLKKEGEPVLSKMRAELEAFLARCAVYQGHEGTQRKFARLFLDLFDGGEKHVLECSLAELHARTGIGLAILRRIVHREPLELLPWLRVEPGETYGRFSISINYQCRDISMVWSRAFQLSQEPNTRMARKGSGGEYGIGALIPPELVCDGERNAAMRNYAYVLKHAGFSLEEVTEALVRLSQSFPSSEGSRHRKRGHIKDIVRCFFRRRHALYPLRYVPADLPSWLREALSSPECLNVNQRRGNSRMGLRILPAAAGDQAPRPGSQSYRERGYGEHMAEGLSPAHVSAPIVRLWDCSDGTRTVRLYAVPYRNRIGIFDADELVLCVTRCRNYVPSRVAEYIQRTLPKYRSAEIVVRKIREGSSIDGAVEKISTAASVLPSRLVCGAAETLDVGLARWRERRGIRPDSNSGRLSNANEEPCF